MSRFFRRLLPVLGLSLLIAVPAEAGKKDGEGVPVKVMVSDDEGDPIATAVVRHPDEADRHRVNAVDGSWEASVLYMPDGTELVFAPGLTLKLEVSAPGYMTQVLQYDVRKRNNKIQITLSKLELESEEIEEPVIQFGRDRPREDNGGAPAN
ncbi:MAG: hypothetical protein ABIO70_18720 [Pseudomonadota bacterium]